MIDFFSHQRYQLFVAIFILCAACLLTPAAPGGERVSLFGMEIPTTCPHRLLFDSSCPGCGLVRSFTALAHGRPGEAVAFHRFGPLLFIGVLLQIPFRLYLLKTGPAGMKPPVSTFLNWSGPFLMLTLVVSWFGLQFKWF